MSHIGTAASGRVLAIDYGRKRLGLAVSDELRVTARPLATWNRSNRRQELARLRTLCRQEGIVHVVVGWPVQLDGEPGEMAVEAAQFAERIHKNLGLPVELVDERLSSWEAEQMLAQSHPGRLRPRRRKQHKLDQAAAAVILRDYLRRASVTP